MTCKGTGGEKAKYMYYFCDNCNLYYNEDEIENCLIDYILDLVEYDFHVKKYFYPILAEKKNDEGVKIDEEIKKIKAQKDRLKKSIYGTESLKWMTFQRTIRLLKKKYQYLKIKKLMH